MNRQLLFNLAVPEGWHTLTVDEIKAPEKSSCVAGPFGSSISSKYFEPEGVPVIRGSNLRDDLTPFVPEGFVFVSFERAQHYRAQHVRGGDLVFTCWGTLGQVGLIPKDGPYPEYIISNKQLKLRPNPEIADSRFLFYYFASPQMVRHIRTIGIGAAVPGINLGLLKGIKITLPPLSTQRLIVSVLSAYDDLIKSNISRIKILEEMAKTIYREWFVHFRFPRHEKVKMIESAGGKTVPDGWHLQLVGTTSLNFDSKRKPLSSIEREKRKGPYPYYGAAKVFDYIDDYIFEGRYLLFAEDGSVMTSDRKPVLQLTDSKFWANNHTHILQGKPPVSTNFLYLSLQDVDISGCVTGAAQPKITQANLNRIPVLVPTEPLLSDFNAVSSPILEQVTILNRQNANLRQTRDLLLPNLISGKVNVANFDAEAVAQGV